MIDWVILGLIIGGFAFLSGYTTAWQQRNTEAVQSVGDAFEEGCAFILRRCGCPECLALLALTPTNQFSYLDVEVVDYTRVESATYPEDRIPEGEAHVAQ